MSVTNIISIILIVLGCIVLTYSGIFFTTPGKPVEFLGLQIETRESHFIPPMAGIIALAGGMVLLVLKPGADR